MISQVCVVLDHRQQLLAVLGILYFAHLLEALQQVNHGLAEQGVVVGNVHSKLFVHALKA
jgi:hypothetical protein